MLKRVKEVRALSISKAWSEFPKYIFEVLSESTVLDDFNIAKSNFLSAEASERSTVALCLYILTLSIVDDPVEMCSSW